MITEFGGGSYFLYRHIRLDTNQVFYIGLGKVKDYQTPKSRYHRAYTTRGRNYLWKAISAKSGYRVEIILEMANRETIIQKEIEFIALYGRRDLDQGNLVNLTIGGDGVSISYYKKRNTISQLRKSVYVYDLSGSFVKKFDSIKHCADFIKCKPARITRALGTGYFYKNHQYFLQFKGNKILCKKWNDKSKNKRPVVQLTTTSEYVATFNSAIEAEQILMISSASISQVCNGKVRKQAGGFRWMFESAYLQKINCPIE